VPRDAGVRVDDELPGYTGIALAVLQDRSLAREERMALGLAQTEAEAQATVLGVLVARAGSSVTHGPEIPKLPLADC
jgi:hypothetical protein